MVYMGSWVAEGEVQIVSRCQTRGNGTEWEKEIYITYDTAAGDKFEFSARYARVGECFEGDRC